MQKIIYVICEGHTEEQFVKTVLKEYFDRFGIVIKPCAHIGKADNNLGGVSKYSIIKKAVGNFCNREP